MVRVRHSYSSIGNTVGGIIMLVVGIGVLIGAFFYTNSINSKLAKWPRATATVVDYVLSYRTDHNYTTDPMYAEVLEYTVNGEIITVKSDVSSNIPPILNVKKEIAYNPDVPTDFVYADGVDKSLPQILLFVAGGVFTAVGVLLLVTIIVRYVKKKRMPKIEAAPSTSYNSYDTSDIFTEGGFMDGDKDRKEDEPYEKLHYGD